MRFLALVLCLLAGTAGAQQAERGQGVILRALDKFKGEVRDIELRMGGAAAFGSLEIFLVECRYPAGNPAGDAWAELEIAEAGKAGTAFTGWMVASSPALSAMDHPRYDVWVLRCITS
ncbi:DUF2155 domain-containing protein [Sulfitobacter sp. D35]|uniref:DUF2155 domain-containing protein n=1 Tax=Sulfitobacter sp. D35 TaxID=3083252 RepID=UPI00296EEAC6|nr:DUF2155 domain-containing protein [Sulfitobacter sp. D35]MDW4497493.1 DUF2155 domain-containing protein [Sulfitobacter sp. D35]